MAKRVVLTGGPCSGKTTILNSLVSTYSCKLLFVPEIASLVIESGVPRENTNDRKIFQKTIFNIQNYYEDAIYSIADSLSRNVICDRGSIDGAAFWPNGEFFAELNTTREAEYSRYEIVLYLSSLASNDPDLYYKNADPARVESVQEAKMLDERLLELWSDHPNFHHIPFFSSGIRNKLAIVLSVLENHEII